MLYVSSFKIQNQTKCRQRLPVGAAAVEIEEESNDDTLFISRNMRLVVIVDSYLPNTSHDDEE